MFNIQCNILLFVEYRVYTIGTIRIVTAATQLLISLFIDQNSKSMVFIPQQFQYNQIS